MEVKKEILEFSELYAIDFIMWIYKNHFISNMGSIWINPKNEKYTLVELLEKYKSQKGL